MISIGLGTIVGGNGSTLGGFSAEYQAILTAASGFTRPSSVEQNLQNQLIVDLKNAGIWAKLDAFYMFANNISTDSTGAFARINWKNPTANYGTAYNANGVPTIIAKNGFTAGSSKALNLNLNPTTSGLNFNSSGASLGVYFGTIHSVSSAVLGTINGISNQVRLRNGPTSSSQIAGSTVISTYKENQFVQLNRTETAGPVRTIQAFIDGVSAGTSPATTAWNLTDTAWNLFYNGTSFGDITQARIGFIGGNLASEASAFRAILREYFNMLFATTNLLINPTNITLSPWAATTEFTPALTHYNSGGITNLPYDNLRATSPNLGFYYQSFDVSGVSPAVPNGTFSVYLKGTGSVRLGIYNNGTSTTTTVTLTTSWRQYSVTRTNIIAIYTEIAIYIDGTSDIDICYPNFEATTIPNPLP